jgi:hypothetical protein
MADLLDLSVEDVVAAGRVLFGPAFRADGLGWRVDLKTTYRRRALETHPDRASATGRSESDLSREFRRVSEAYRILSQLAAGPLPTPARGAAAAPTPPPPRAARPPPAGGARRRDVPGGPARREAPREALPRRRLRLAEYLYYTGRVPWTAFVEAISWQRGQRPPVGRIAVEWGFLEPEDVSRILEERRVRDAGRVPFGEFAVRLGYLTSFQVLAVLGRQLRGQRRIGEFFVERGLLEPAELDELRRGMARHNARWRE